MHDDDTLTPLDPAYRTMLRIEGALAAIPLLILAISLTVIPEVPSIVTGIVWALVALLILAIILYLPMRRWAARGYDMGSDRLRVVKGVMFHADTVVPFSRVQHIDVEQGPLERLLGIARLILHTAGTHNASVTLPGLRHADATAMREDIRQHVKRESQ
ncbi:PH domain-containing protein [Aurantiacibacter gangjinensis]|uniref:Uncharacterized protein n=1 Tax=Aurantiacibacter gangjinensis TaxID=502682 RepID=A0A0G9MLP9_9SPHN|nr:PH domain-containing protein [Aurantiacibacter gangjinensis]APE27595.1 hypothetical protein BMF35_a0766 [Aurantiacibacter gangjinensis]KLE31631.1 hypothetical protein AAW01_08810 [Aurantiacibacter gangjinensis]